MMGVKQAYVRIRIFALTVICLLFGHKYCSQIIKYIASFIGFHPFAKLSIAFIKKCLKVLSCKISSLIFTKTFLNEQDEDWQDNSYPPLELNQWTINQWPKMKYLKWWDHHARDDYTHWASTRKPSDAYFEDVEMLKTTPFNVVIHFHPDQINVPKGEFTCLDVQFERVLIQEEYWNTIKQKFHISLVVWDYKTNAYTIINENDMEFLVNTFSKPVNCTFIVHVSSGGCIFLDKSDNSTMQEFLEIVKKSNSRGAHISLD